MKIFLSYCNKNRTEADHIDQVFRDAGYQVLRDIREVGFKDDLHQYCDWIRDCQAAICLISDAYLKSRWCMYEILQLMKERQFEEKIIPVVLGDARIFSAEDRLDYIQHWHGKYETLKTKAEGLDLSTLPEIAQELKLYTCIKNETGYFTTAIGNWLLRKYGELLKTGFLEIFEALGPPFDSSYQLLLKLMAERIQGELQKKLHGIDYVPMDLDYGTIPGKKKDSSQLEHGREWQRFNLKELLPFNKKYVLSSSVGMGKTTFVYHLAGQLLKAGYLPLVFSCQEFEKINPDTVFRLEKYFADIYTDHSGRKLKQEIIRDILENHRGKIVFLFDGLDQIISDKYGYLAGMIDKVCINYPLLITSRPSAVNFFEPRRNYIFLRLQLFAQKSLIDFFGEKYAKARELTTFAPDLIRTPMLAYMVKKLLEDDTVKGIQTRTELYQAFVAYILREQNQDEYKPTIARNVILNLQRISFTALALENPLIQKISLGHCFKQLENISCEKLTTYGLVNLALEKSDFLYFTHQSFQEYFAACYVKENQEFVDVIIKQQWNPKWKEVIKFLAGLMGTSFVEMVYRGEDNVIHSRLFLAAECVAEMREKDSKYVKKLIDDLNGIPYDKPLPYEKPFEAGILEAYLYLGNVDYVLTLLRDWISDHSFIYRSSMGKINNTLPEAIILPLGELLRDQDSMVRARAANALGNHGNLPESIINQLGELLRDQDSDVRRSAAYALGKIGNLPEIIIYQLGELLHDQDCDVRNGAVYALGNIGSLLPESIITQIGELLRDQDNFVRRSAASALGKIGNLPETIIYQLGELLRDQEWDVRSRAVEALGNIGSLPESIINQMGELLRDQYSDVRWSAASALGQIGNLPESIINQLVELLHDRDNRVHERAAEALGKIGNLPESIINQLVELLRDQDSWVRWSAASALGKIGNLPESIIDQLAEFLCDQDSWVRWSAASALGQIGNLPGSIINQLGELLRDQDRFVRMSAASALEKAGNLPKSIINQLVELLYDQDSKIRSRAVDALLNISNLSEFISINELGKLLCDPDIYVRSRAAIALGRISNLPESIINQLVELLLHEQDSYICERAVEALVNISNLPESTFNQLVELLHDQKSYIRFKAAAILKGLYKRGKLERYGGK